MIKNWIKNSLSFESKLYQLLSRVYNIRTYWRPPISNIPTALEKLASHDQVKFLQIGANDGVTNDKLYKHVIKGNWSGVLVEPIPYIFELLKSNYADQNNLFFENSALSTTTGTQTFYQIAKKMRDEIPNYERMGTLKREILEGLEIRLDQQFIEEVEVCTCTFDDLLDKYEIVDLDLILIDAEGYDLEILKLIDFNRVRPNMIIYENANLSNSEYKESLKLLKSEGYQLFEQGLDSLALRS